MAEPRARAARHKGQLNFEQELRQFLYAFGDDKDPLPETVRVLDEIVTDYIIETCHTAAKSADIVGRQKIKVDDFKFAIRNDEMASGRVKELLQIDKHLRDSRKQFDVGEGKVGLERGGRKKKEVNGLGGGAADVDAGTEKNGKTTSTAMDMMDVGEEDAD